MATGRSLIVVSRRVEREAGVASVSGLQNMLEKSQKREVGSGVVSAAGVLIGLGAFMLSRESPETIYSVGMVVGLGVWYLGARLAISFDLARSIVESEAKKRGLRVGGEFLRRRIEENSD